MTIDRLYRVSSDVNKWAHRGRRYDNVHITWLRDGQRFDTPEAYAPFIDGDPSDGYTQFTIDELFTRDEAEALAHYLKEQHNTDVSITEYQLPVISGQSMPLSAVPLGGGVDSFMLSQVPGYDLPFEVSGYFDVRDPGVTLHSTLDKEDVDAILEDIAWANEQTPGLALEAHAVPHDDGSYSMVVANPATSAEVELNTIDEYDGGKLFRLFRRPR